MATQGKWILVPGGLKQVSVGSRQYIWGVNGSSQIFDAVGGIAYWSNVAGALSCVSVGADGTVWGVDSTGKIYRRDGSSWTQIPGVLSQISCGSATNVWGVNSARNIFKWVNNGWTPVPGSLANVSVASDGTVWGVDASGNIFRWDGSKWVQVPGTLTQVSCGSASIIWGVNNAGNIFRWTGSTWDVVSGTLANISAAADGTVWGVNSAGNIFYFLPDEPLLISNPALLEKKLEPTETADYGFTVTNVASGVTATNISLTPVYDKKLFDANKIAVSGIPLTVPSLAPGASATLKFTITTNGATVGPYAFYGVNGTYTLTSSDNTINVNSTGGWMNFQVEED
ncbi:tectonin domain-containing protein [Azospirillum sp. Sh1]|uniref:tectonin domain-containing protein n=1 Tax=Azospirillum sp. Sh1 TaxID=2607285 RepID=UPI00165E57AE|nr:tectonin domain-containing protein [Azospirillum sp. Sh1]